MKFVITALVVVFLLWLLFGRARKPHRERPSAAPPASPVAEGMLACAHCGVHLPASETLRVGPHAFCCAAHRDAGPRDDAA